MKRHIKKILVSVLASLMLVTNFTCKPINADIDVQALATTKEVLDRASQLSDALTDLRKVSISYSGNKSIIGHSVVKSISSFLTLTVSILKACGVFGRQQDWRLTAINNINNRLDGISNELSMIEKDLDRIESNLSQQLAEIGEDVKEIDNTLNKQTINRVALVAKTITDKIEQYDDMVKYNIMNWYEIDYNESLSRKLTVSYYVDADGTTNSVFLPNSLIANVLMDTQEEWKIEKEEDVKRLVGKVFINAIEEAKNNTKYESTYNDFVDYCNVMLAAETELAYKGKTLGNLNLQVENDKKEYDKILASFVDAAYDALSYECMKRIAKSSTEAATSYASTLVSAFTTYCNYLNEASSEYSSPLKAQYNIYSNLYAFQGELKCTTEYKDENGVIQKKDTNLAALVNEKYFIELNKIGTFVAEIAKASGAYTNDSLHNKVFVPWAKAEASINKDYTDFYKVDCNGNEIDNYCYVTKSVLKYDLNNVSATTHISYEDFEEKVGGIPKHKVVTFDKNITKDWSYSVGNDYILSNSQLSKIYAHYLSNRGSRDSLGFYDFLYAAKVCDTKIDETYYYSPLIITHFGGGQDLGSSDKVKMLAIPLAPSTHEKFKKDNGNYPLVMKAQYAPDAFYKYVGIYEITISGSTGDMPVKRKAIADTFNPLNGETETNANVGTVALFYEWYKHQDDMAMLVSSEYRSLRYINGSYNGDPAINNEARNFDRTFTLDDSNSTRGDFSREEVYNTYTRGYGAIISNDVDVYKTNGKISKTNSIEVLPANNILANSFVGKITFANAAENNYLPTNITDTEVKDTYKKIAGSAKEKFEALLETLYPDNQEDIEKLKANNVYSISFDNGKYSNVDDETYQAIVKKLVEYLKPDAQGNNANINEMIEAYRELYSEMIKTIDTTKAENNDIEINISDEAYNELIETLIHEYLDPILEENTSATYSVCANLPASKTDTFVYCENDGEIYVWTGSKYEKVRDVRKNEVPDFTTLQDGTVVVSDGIYTATGVPNEYCGKYIYNSEDSKYYKWKEVEIPEYVGEYEKILQIKVVNSVPATESDRYLYNTTDKTYYTWGNHNEAKYIKQNVPIVTDEKTYAGELVMIGSDYYVWSNVEETVEENYELRKKDGQTVNAKVDDIVCVDKYVKIEIHEVDELPETNDYLYLICGGDCYKSTSTEVISYYPVTVKGVGALTKVDSLSDKRKFVSRFILFNNELYEWKDKAYQEKSHYEVATETIKKIGEIATKKEPANAIEVDVYPSTLSKQLNLVYDIKPTISFEMYFDKEINNKNDVATANIKYDVVPYYDITPMLTWVDKSGTRRYVEVSDEVLRKSNINSIPVKIPVVQMNDNNDTNALIYHYDNLDYTSCPIDQYNPRIKTDANGNKYAIIAAKSFSPFMVKKTYTRNSSPSEKYNIPNTGIR